MTLGGTADTAGATAEPLRVPPYGLRWGGRTIRLILLGKIAKDPRNAPWEVFSARLDRLRHGLRHYRPREPLGRDLLAQLYFTYCLEAPGMTYTVEDFKRDTQRLRIAHLHELDPELFQTLLAEIPTEALLSRLGPEERLRGLDPAERLRGLDPAERLRGLDPEQRLSGLDAEQRLSGLDPAVVEDWLKRRGH